MIAKHPSRNRIVRTVDDLEAGHWMARQLPKGTSLRGYAEDHAVSTLTGAVLDAIEETDLNRTDIARLLGTTKSYVSQVLNGHNMTLKTFGALLWATGQQVACVVREPVAYEKSRPVAMYVLQGKHSEVYQRNLLVAQSQMPTPNLRIDYRVT